MGFLTVQNQNPRFFFFFCFPYLLVVWCVVHLDCIKLICILILFYMKLIFRKRLVYV
ncbi:hypothetical protein AtNW77_Chr1g0060771 [Arabidopsis thaliana]